MSESIPLPVCAKEDFDSFKLAEPSKATAPTKVKSRAPQPRTSARYAITLTLPLASKDSVDTNYGESQHPFDLLVERSMVSANVMGRCLAA